MSITRAALVFFLFGALLCRPAAAQESFSAADPEGLAAAFIEMGYQAEVRKDGTGDPIIYSRANGGTFQIEFYGCTENQQCKTLRFFVGYDLSDGTTLDRINEWNSAQRFASAFVDAENDPFLQMDVNTEGGISRRALQTSMEAWQALKRQFEGHINFRR
jgi:hypothetical protein